MKYLSTILLNLVVPVALLAQVNMSSLQEFQRAYANGKELFQLEKYELAMAAFEGITGQHPSNPFAEYASYYYALSAYRAGNTALARDMFLQVSRKFPNWQQLDDCYLWLAQINFENEDYFQGIFYIEKITGEQEAGSSIKNHFIRPIRDIDLLSDLYEKYPEDNDIAWALAKSISEQSLQEKNHRWLNDIVVKHGFDAEEFNTVQIAESVIKDRYTVAVLLPLMIDDLEPIRGRKSNQFILDIYEGIKLAHEKASEDRDNVDLLVYDTRRDSAITAGILQQQELLEADIIIGPLYPQPSRLASEFAFKNKINIINPLSSNSEVIGNNPFSFLYGPSSETVAATVASYITNTITNKNAIIYYGESQQDSVLAHSYRQIIEQDSFNIVICQKIIRENTRQIFDTLAATYQVRDTLDLNPESDFIDVLVIEPDSIGHVFVASAAGSMASNVISAIEARGDSLHMQVIGNENWLDLRSSDYQVMERLGIIYAAPNYFTQPNTLYTELRDKYLELNYTLPTKNVTIGYDLMLFLHRSLSLYGKYFQVAALEDEFSSGLIKSGYYYQQGNDNRLVPLVKLEESRIVEIPVPEAQEIDDLKE